MDNIFVFPKLRIGDLVHVSKLLLGHIVRPVGVAYDYRIRSYNVTAPIDHDRFGYDTMTVAHIDDERVHMRRPYFHINHDGSVGAIGVEDYAVYKNAEGSYFEILGGVR